MKIPKVIILHNRVDKNSRPDELDVLHQAQLVEKALGHLGYETSVMDFGRDIFGDIEKVADAKPSFVFNLGESVHDKAELLYFVPSLLRMHKLAYTGSDAESILLTTNKIITKRQLVQWGIPTANWLELGKISSFSERRQFILKPVLEDGSVGIQDDPLVWLPVKSLPKRFESLSPAQYFLEEFLEGREFNLSMISGKNGPVVLPPAEMIYQDFPDTLPKILTYKAKWETESLEYKNTNRQFDTLDPDDPLARTMADMARRCWDLFGLKGYARVDFRLDAQGHAKVLEVNANPCISPDSGFIAAVLKAGMSIPDAIGNIISDLNK